jgi:hypothetical protein
VRSKLFSAGRATNTLVISYYPLSGNDENTGPRYQAEADATGYDILGITRVGSNTLKPSPLMRRSLSPERFAEACAQDVEELNLVTKPYDHVLMRGQSTGSFPTLAIAKSRMVRVTHLLIEDGINTRVSSNRWHGRPIGSRMDWLRYGRQERERMPRPPQEGWTVPQVASSTLRNGLKFAVEQYHWAPLWRSWYSVDALDDIATRQSDLPILVKFLGHTGTSTEQEIDNLCGRLAAIDRLRSSGSVPAAQIRTDYDPEGWHGFLVYPQYGARNLVEARSMASLVAK